MEPDRYVVGSGLGNIEEAKCLTVKSLIEAAEAILRDAGCKIVRARETTDIIINYPPGTTRQELFPRTTESRYRVLLPGGIELREIESRAQGCTGLYILKDTLPPQYTRQ
jgi:hypothetical protein